jgi:1-acyl-sn-glycerol-3-phosphate acyltransferase
VIALALPRQITFLAKEELFSVPLMGRWIRWLGAHPVDRNRGDVKALRVAMRLLGEGKALLVFPEGTRSKDGALQPLEQGIAWLSLKASVPIVPLYIDGSYQSMPLGSLFPRPTPIRLLLGEPLIPQDFTRNGVGKTLIAQYTQEIERRLTNLHLTACREDTGKDGKMEIKA